MNWISVKERLPEADAGWVLVYAVGGDRPVSDAKFLYIDDDYGPQWTSNHLSNKITH